MARVKEDFQEFKDKEYQRLRKEQEQDKLDYLYQSEVLDKTIIKVHKVQPIKKKNYLAQVDNNS